MLFTGEFTISRVKLSTGWSTAQPDLVAAAARHVSQPQQLQQRCSIIFWSFCFHGIVLCGNASACRHLHSSSSVNVLCTGLDKHADSNTARSADSLVSHHNIWDARNCSVRGDILLVVSESSISRSWTAVHETPVSAFSLFGSVLTHMLEYE